MSRFGIRCGTVVLGVTCMAAMLVVPSTTASAGRTGFSGNLCAAVPAGALKALKISAPCVRQKPLTHVQSTAFGSVRSVTYLAHWRSGGTFANPKPNLSIEVIDVSGSAAAVAYLGKAWRLQVLANGIPVSLHPLATESGDTATCHNPPTGDCTEAELLALVGQYAVTIEYFAPAKFIQPDDPQDPAVGESNDRAQEEAIKKPFVGLAKSVMAAL
jgi:hypothetical protein